MSIVMNRHLEYEELLDCIKMAIPHIKTFLEYPDKTNLADSNDNQTILIYSEDSFYANGFMSALSIHTSCEYDDNAENIISETLALAISLHFKCRTACSAARLAGDDSYELVFEEGKIYFSENIRYDSFGVKIAEIKYEIPKI